MGKTYNAILRGNTIEWKADSPSVDTESGVKVQITVMKQYEGTEEERKAKLRAALKKLASLPSSFPDDLVEWQKGTRQDRPLPGRD